MCSMALLHRCGVVSDVTASKDVTGVTGVTVDRRQPKCYVGLCGVYDVARHYDYEDPRGGAREHDGPGAWEARVTSSGARR